MDTLDRFLIREFVSYFLLVLVLLASLYIGIDFLSKFWGMNMPMAKIVEIYTYRIPATLQLFLPISCMMACLLVLSTMSRQNEILALYSNGVSQFRLVSTFIATVAATSTIAFLIFDSLVPAFNKRQILLERGLDPSQEFIGNEKRSAFWYRSGHLIYNVGSFNPATNTLEDIRIYALSPQFNIAEILHSPRAVFQDNQWKAEAGTRIFYPTVPGFPISETFKARAGLIPEKPSDFKTLTVQEDTMRLRDLRQYIRRNSGYGLDTTAQRVTYHERVAQVFSPLVFILLAIPFAIHPLRNKSPAKSIGFCFLVVFVYLLFSRFALSAGRGGHIPPVVAGWLANVVFLLFTLFLTMRRRHA